ncbi:MAG: NADH-quinone oxidoreductase subunit C, partial [Candidatus Omnitrophica bacterium]|nr:NADH-quinone oxidoreductase subunit C [Candidatus Omnitrophota bacterium]
MDNSEIITGIKKKFTDFSPLSVSGDYPDEVTIKVNPPDFKATCLALHKILPSPVMALFALDERKERGCFGINSVFVDFGNSRWITVNMDIPQENPGFDSLAKSMHSASLFEREIWEMFGIHPIGHPDLRRLRLHDEICPKENYPLRKDFQRIQSGALSDYKFGRVEGEGIFEVPVGPVHAGIIGPGHFRFSVAGEPIINLELRLGFTHR